MDADWRPVQGCHLAAAAGADWRAQLQPEERSRIVDMMMETLKKRLLAPVPEELKELLKIAVQSEEKIYTTATNHSDYFREINREMLSMEMETQQARGNAQVITNQNNSGQAHAGAVDWQEEIYQMIKRLKEQHFAELNELYNKLSAKLQQIDSIIPCKTPSEQHERMKSFKILLGRIIQMLLISKSAIQPSLRDKIPLYERQILNIRNAQRSHKPPT